jgi:PAS domain S-box-containing protein
MYIKNKMIKNKKNEIERKLKESEVRYRRLFETAHDGILILNSKTGQITDVNPFLEKLLGYSKCEFLNKKLWEVGAFKNIKASREAFKTLQKRG